jgi:mRNA-degrading endonuclease YafQ of YafQ-DinJ toxin-antitoxin module
MGKYLMTVDLQKQFIDTYNGSRDYKKCIKYINESQNEYDGIITTLFKQNENNTNFKNHLEYDSCENASIKDLEFYDEISKNKNIKIIIKNGYGISMDELKFIKKDDYIDIIGCDALSNVMAICFQLWDRGYVNLRILTDYIYTNADEMDGILRQDWINILRRNFGDCVIIPKRRICFDALFIAPDKYIKYKGKEYMADVSLLFEYKLTYGNGIEVYLKKDEQNIMYPPCLFSIDRKKGFKMEYKENKDAMYTVDEVSSDSAFIWENPMTPVEIPFKDAVQILKDNYDIYDRTSNRPAQSISYCIKEIQR